MQNNRVVHDLNKIKVPPGTLILVRGVETSGATSIEVVLANVIENLKYNYPMFEDMIEYNKSKSNKPIALVGGGPSLRNTHILRGLSHYRTTMACGSVHDYLMECGIVPTYAVNCDPSPISANYFTKPDPEVKYLIASNADKKTMEALRGHQVIMWHCHSDELQQKLFELGHNTYNAVGGGCTVGMRAISLAICMGYSNIHFFGFDSCMSVDAKEHHAYKWADEEEESKLIDKIYKICLGPPTGPEDDRTYYVAGYQLAQLENFKDFYLSNKQFFTPTFHGGGALAHYYELIKRIKPTESNSQKEELVQ